MQGATSTTCTAPGSRAPEPRAVRSTACSNSEVTANIPALDLERARPLLRRHPRLADRPTRTPGGSCSTRRPPARSSAATGPSTPARRATPSPSSTSPTWGRKGAPPPGAGCHLRLLRPARHDLGRRRRSDGRHGPRRLVQGQRGQHPLPRRHGDGLTGHARCSWIASTGHVRAAGSHSPAHARAARSAPTGTRARVGPPRRDLHRPGFCAPEVTGHDPLASCASTTGGDR